MEWSRASLPGIVTKDVDQRRDDRGWETLPWGGLRRLVPAGDGMLPGVTQQRGRKPSRRPGPGFRSRPWHGTWRSGKSMSFSLADVPRNPQGRAPWGSTQHLSSFLTSFGLALLPGSMCSCSSRVWAQLVQKPPSNLPVISLKDMWPNLGQGHLKLEVSGKALSQSPRRGLRNGVFSLPLDVIIKVLKVDAACLTTSLRERPTHEERQAWRTTGKWSGAPGIDTNSVLRVPCSTIPLCPKLASRD